MTPAKSADKLRTRRAAQALALWQGVVLTGISTVTVLSIWHLRRRSRMIRDRLRPQHFPEKSLADLQAELSEPAPDALHDKRS